MPSQAPKNITILIFQFLFMTFTHAMSYLYILFISFNYVHPLEPNIWLRTISTHYFHFIQVYASKCSHAFSWGGIYRLHLVRICPRPDCKATKELSSLYPYHDCFGHAYLRACQQRNPLQVILYKPHQLAIGDHSIAKFLTINKSTIVHPKLQR